MTSTFRRYLAAGLVAAILPVATTVAAQEKPADVAVREIREMAESFTGNMSELALQLRDLPANMEGAPEMFDEMVAAIDAMMANVGNDSEIAESVFALRAEAEQYREQWRERCSSTNNVRDCARVELWNEKVVEALEAEDTYAALIQGIEDSRSTILENKIYAVDDIRLSLFKSALDGLNGALDELGVIHSALSALATSVGGDPLDEPARVTDG